METVFCEISLASK